MKTKTKLIYNIVTGIFTAHMLMTVVMYIFAHDMVADMFTSLGVPVEIIYPLAAAKVLGLIAIWSNKSKLLKELAYLGFALDFIGAAATHISVGDGHEAAPIVALLVAIVSYVFYKKLSKEQIGA